MHLLEVTGVSKRFGGITALRDINLKIHDKEIMGLIGPNGSGKTTLFNVITGLYKPDSGTVKFQGEDITGLKPHHVCRRGIARTFQLVRPFLDESVLRNTMVGRLFGREHTTDLKEAKEDAYKILEFVGLTGKADIPAKNLTTNDRKALEFAKALASKPKIILLDEMLAGLNPVETQRQVELIAKVRINMGVTVFMIEHVMAAVMQVSDRITVLNFGQMIAEGTPSEISSDPSVIQAYLGEEVS